MPRKRMWTRREAVALGKRLTAAREMAGTTQRELSEEGFVPAYISRIEAGERFPSVPLIRRMAAKLGVEIGWLETGRKQPSLEQAVAWIEWFAQTDACLDIARRLDRQPILVASSAWGGLWKDQFTPGAELDSARGEGDAALRDAVPSG